MDEEIMSQAEAAESRAGEPAEVEDAIDWKAKARKWEKLAKKSRAAEDELAALKQSHESELAELRKSTADELASAIARAERAEARANELQAKADREQTIRELSETTGTPAELLEYCADEEAMEAMVQTYKEAKRAERPSVAAAASFTRIVRDDTPPRSPREEFADWARENLRP